MWSRSEIHLESVIKLLQDSPLESVLTDTDQEQIQIQTASLLTGSDTHIMVISLNNTWWTSLSRSSYVQEFFNLKLKVTTHQQ